MWKYPMKENFVFIQTEKSKRQRKECKISWEEKDVFWCVQEPLLRVMVEGENEAEIQELADYVADVIREQLV